MMLCGLCAWRSFTLIFADTFSRGLRVGAASNDCPPFCFEVTRNPQHALPPCLTPPFAPNIPCEQTRQALFERLGAMIALLDPHSLRDVLQAELPFLTEALRENPTVQVSITPVEPCEAHLRIAGACCSTHDVLTGIAYT